MSDDLQWPPLLTCKKYGLAITENAKKCPSCGAEVNTIKLQMIVVASLLGFLVLIYLLGAYLAGLVIHAF
jgi:hypothetical protein